MNDKKSVEDKLRSLGVILGVDGISQPRKKKRVLLEDVIAGEYEKTPYGEIFVVKEIYPAHYEHGIITFPDKLSYEMIAKWAKVLPKNVTSDLDRVAFIDTETSGLSRGSGTIAFLIGIGFMHRGQFHLNQIFITDPSQEQAALSALTHYLDPFEFIVSYNGKSFDVPILEHRHIINGFTSPISTLHHIDLLHLVRKIYKNRLASRRLGDLETNLLNFQRDKEEVPGWLVPQIYKDFLTTGDPQPLTGVFYHNAIDIVTLAAVFVVTAQLLENPLSDQTDHLDLLAIGNLYEELRIFDTAIEIYEQCLVSDLPKPLFLKTLIRYASMYKKANEYRKAVILWEKAAIMDDVAACVELAKYYEHSQKDYDAALAWTDQALGILSKDPDLLSQLSLPDVIHRKNRLERKHSNT